jgi:hypothetical protein
MRKERPGLAPLGPAKIGAALRAHWLEIDREPLREAFDTLHDTFDSISQPARSLEQLGILSRHEKIGRVFQLASEVGAPVTSVFLLLNEVLGGFQLEALRAAAKQEGLPADALIEGGQVLEHLGEPPTDEDLGTSLQQAVENCIDSIKRGSESPTKSDKAIVARLAKTCLDRVLSELERLKILGVCAYPNCGKTFFPSGRGKRVCSLEYEGRNCSNNFRSQRSYERHKSDG